MKKYFVVLDQQNQIIPETINNNLEKVNDDKQTIKLNLAIAELTKTNQSLDISSIAELASQFNISIRELTYQEVLKYVKKAN